MTVTEVPQPVMAHPLKTVATPAAVKPTLSDHISNKDLLQHTAFIDGKWGTAAPVESTYQVFNPATLEELGAVDMCGAVDATAAIEAARTAFQSWRKTTAQERAAIMNRWAALIGENSEDLGKLVVLETGKPLQLATWEAYGTKGALEWFAAESVRTSGKTLQPEAASSRNMTIMQPVGVVAAITPWNFPIVLAMMKIGPALAAGCTIILKPSEETPFSTMAMMQLAKEAGIPDGVINVVSGDAPAIGEVFTRHQAVRKIAFTGSVRVGKLLARAAADACKRVTLELGGNCPFVVFADADIEAVAAAAVQWSTINGGQTCFRANRILVAEEVHDKLRDAMKAGLEAMKVGNGMDEGTEMGPLINKARLEAAQEAVDEAVAKGATVVCGGGPVEGVGRGNFFKPTLLTDVPRATKLFHEESFAPIVPFFKFKTEEEAVEMANDTEYGLAAYCFTKDVSRAFRMSEALEAGMVGINELNVVHRNAPFGGTKQSGIGRENGQEGMKEYMIEKHVALGI